MGENQRPVRAAAAKSKMTMRLGSNATQVLKNPFRSSDKPAKKSDRQELRQQIAETTEVKRKRYLIEKKDYFLPLLPEHNYINKIAAAQHALSSVEKAKELSIPYEQLTEQPKGVKATMKDYQLSGLSFLVFLYRNGLSGILGDEMGLGKTLQTISLMQWLKENEPAGREPRPFLIVCPLSVLGTWQSELKKWTPGLKAVRFHGVKEERERVKKIATGELDFYGHQTKARTKKLKKAQARLRAKKGGYSTSSSFSEQDDEDTDYTDTNPENAPDVIITTYDTYKAEQSWFQRAYVWKYIVLDEGHMIKNEESQISKALQALKAEYRLLLSGTPLQNNLGELWALFHWLYPMIFTLNTKQLFLDSYDLTHGKYIASTLDDSRELLQLCMLRRMKRDVGLNLPPKTDVLLFVPLTPMQRFWYQRFITRAGQGLLDDVFKGAKTKEEGASATDDIKLELDEIAAAMEASNQDGSLIETTHHALLKDALAREDAEAKKDQRSSTWQKLQNLLMQLRKVCNHPYTVYDPATDDEYNQHLVHASGKFIVLEKIINELVVKQNKKVVIFSCFTSMLDLTEQLMYNMSEDGALFQSVRIDGSVSSARRNLGMRLFQDPTSNVNVFMLSTRAGGLGITLTAATEMIFLDSDFNPQVSVQAEARSHRIGQTKPVTVYKLASQGTVEEQMLGRISKKLYLATKVTESMRDIHTQTPYSQKRGRPGQSDNDLPAMTTNQLMQLMRRGTTALSREQIDVSEMVAWDWPTTLAKCKDQALDVNVKKDTTGASIDAEEEEKWLKELEKVETKIFEGKELARSKPQTRKELDKEFAQEFNHADRRIGKNVTVEVDGYMINKESMLCKWGEAFPTIGDKDPRLAEPKKAKKAPIDNQAYCQICLDGGELALCDRCPRSYHVRCLSPQMRANLKATSLSWSCPQHECIDCSRKTAQCGGMLYRCRFCEAAHCEDCIDFDSTNLVGENLKEYRLLGFGHSDQAYYVECQKCLVHWSENPLDKQITLDMIVEFDEDYEKFLTKEKGDAVKASKQAADQAKKLAQVLPFAKSVPAARGESLSSGYDSASDHRPRVLRPADVVMVQNNASGKKAKPAANVAKPLKPAKRAAAISSLGGTVAKKSRLSSVVDLISDSE